MPNPTQPLSATWIFRIQQEMAIGNKFYDRAVMTSGPRLFGVGDAAQQIGQSLGVIAVGTELPVDIAPLHVPQETPVACLPHHIHQAGTSGNAAALFIIQEQTVAFIPLGQQVILLDSHLHGESGACVTIAPMGKVWELLKWYKQFNSIHYNIGTVTSVAFS